MNARRSGGIGLILTLAGAAVGGAGCSGQKAAEDDENVGAVRQAVKTPSPCTTPPANTLFCADFDHVTDVAEGWSIVNLSGKGRGTLDTNHFSSAPASFKAKSVYSQRVDTPPASNASFDVDLDLRVDKLAAGWFARTIQPGSAMLALSLDATGQLAVTEEGGPGAPTVHTTTAVIATKTWTHVKLHATSTSLQASIDGVVVLDVAPRTGMAPGFRSLEIGAQAGKLSFDNVLVTDPPVPAAFYCDSLPPATTLYCNDFDKPTSPTASCSAVDATTFVSAPFSCARAVSPRPPTLDVSVHGATATPTFDFDLRLDKLPAQASSFGMYNVLADAGRCPVGTTPCIGVVNFVIDPGGNLVAILQAGVTRTTVTLATLTVGTWVHVHGRGSAHNGELLSIDGVSKASIPFLVEPGTRHLDITGTGVHIDNVVLADL